MFSRAIHRRNPFKVTALPFIGKLYRAAFRKRRRFGKRFIGKPSKALFKLAYHTLGLKGEGKFLVRIGNDDRSIIFNVRNTQFHALYLPQYAGGYEPEIGALVDILVPDDGNFYDIGANWGYFGLYLACRPSFAGQIHAFEPMPGTFADLESVITQSGLGERVHCHHLALSDKEGVGSMVVGDHLHSGIARLAEKGGGVEVPLQRLDDLDLPPPMLMKTDVEGHEAEVLSGGSAMIKAHKPYIIFESWREFNKPDITLAPFEVLDGLGYVFMQPAWVKQGAGKRFAISEAPGPYEDAEAILALVPFTPDQRFLLGEQINVLAVHRERLEGLKARFKK